MNTELINKCNDLKDELSHLNFNQLSKYLIDRFNLKRIQVESILIFNKRIYRSNFKYNHLIVIIAVLLLEQQDQYLEFSLINKSPYDLE